MEWRDDNSQRSNDPREAVPKHGVKVVPTSLLDGFHPSVRTASLGSWIVGSLGVDVLRARSDAELLSSAQVSRRPGSRVTLL
jgi:hypothetical protein